MKETKIVFQDPDSRLYEINRMGSGQAHKITADELARLEKLMPNVNWIVIQWVKPHGNQERL